MKTSFVIDEDLLKRAKIQAVKDGCSLADLLRNLLIKYLEENENN